MILEMDLLKINPWNDKVWNINIFVSITFWISNRNLNFSKKTNKQPTTYAIYYKVALFKIKLKLFKLFG